ncbi:tRNA pseudouridine(38-40) synthase TruA [Aureivirga sp. CE67]|uniref:tRNA pseudouridine(38-40) synthase TruA n=1 Tax=Aureivirga sp. CE67 TaxID=1788983 RepID=UPI0018C98E9A|nr:tRNA pseudouridine(38-40) synthase TruA [Aureivirga sp. CE67]
MRYFIHLGFDGGKFSGWQRQKSTQNTVQEVIEQTLSRLFKKNIAVYGCGRTDAGVHASQYVIQFEVEEAPSFDLKFRLNKNLPNSIAVFEIFEVEENQHCRYDADIRTYDYFIHWRKDPALSFYSSYYEYENLDFVAMKKTVEIIRNTNDFRALCKQPELYDNTLCMITNCDLFVNEAQGRLRFTISSNRFLRKMIRICVFYLLEVGTGKISVEEFQQIVNLEKEYKVRQAAFPNGLFLSKITYPFLELKDAHNLIKLLKFGLDK